MGVVAESPAIAIIDAIGQPLSVFGIPNPLHDKVMEADFETSPSEDQAAAIAAGIEALRAASASLTVQIPDDAWSGDAKEQSEEVEHCTADFLEMLGDLYIMLVEIVVQVIDYIIDFIRWIVKVCEILLGILVAIVTVAAAFSVISGGSSFAAGAIAASQAMGTSTLAVIASLAAVALLGNILVWAIDSMIEWIQDGLASARERGCFKGEAPLPDPDFGPPVLPW